MSGSRVGFRSVVTLAAVELDPNVSSVRQQYIELFGDPPADLGGWYPDADWQRLSFVLRAIGRHGRFLDVGLGAGQFINSVARAHCFDEIDGVDRIRFNKYVEFDDRIVRHDVSIVELPFPDDHFDVVTCMEVLEHLPDEAYDAGIAELRRVCRGQLVMSVPFEEPEPIYEDHNRRYVIEDLQRDFHGAELVLLERPRMPWALIEEWHGDGDSPERLRVAATEAMVSEIRRGVDRQSRFGTVSERTTAHAKRVLGRALAAFRG